MIFFHGIRRVPDRLKVEASPRTKHTFRSKQTKKLGKGHWYGILGLCFSLSLPRLLLQLENSFRKDKRNNVALQWNLHILGVVEEEDGEVNGELGGGLAGHWLDVEKTQVVK